MTDMPDTPPPPPPAPEARPPLGVGGIIGEAFGILSRRFVALVLLALVPVLVGAVIQYAVLSPMMVMGEPGNPEAMMESGAIGFGIALNFIVGVLVPTVVTALVVQAAFDTRLGRPLEIGRYVNGTLANILPLLVMGFAASIAIMVLMTFLLVPGIWLAAVLCVTVPAIVLERAGFGAFGRSQRLTKEYRWPLVGLGVLTFIVVMVFSLVLEAGLSLLLGGSLMMMGSAGLMTGAPAAIYLLASAVVEAVATAFYCVVISLAYARLREVKEGMATESLLEVF
ncbi:hypothetical protein [Oceanicella sp. SM1341]|uniref:hypothetical protein n=1 Tax=Oceanicella sp. SM1341 TaxID=1548889 RepID=UPI000E4E4EEA|nr:hypothetical protein [Oceanicella sp. SM1341]